ncbi:MAG: c-type cytochrome [Proteobacteria bacterium]|nr:c-type cytochrome [Pseudomonadota bacterium]
MTAISAKITRTFVTNVFALAVIAFSCAAPFSKAVAQQMDAPPDLKDEPGKAESKLPNIENGNNVARKLCTSCHLIGEPANAPVPSDVPTFASIANRQGQTLDHLATWLTRPHPPMPNLNLTRMEIRDLAGYIMSLRTEK